MPAALRRGSRARHKGGRGAAAAAGVLWLSEAYVGAGALSMLRALCGREQYARRCRRVGGEPAVRERLLRAEPVLGLELQQTAHEVLRGSRAAE